MEIIHSLLIIPKEICNKISSNGRLGVRHVTGNPLAEKEAKEGFKMGCSQNINPCLSDELRIAFDKLPQEERCMQLEQRIKGFIKDSFVIDMGAKYDPAKPPHARNCTR
jgi:hypothetical protein